MTRISLPARSDTETSEAPAPPARGVRAMADRAEAINARLARGRALAGSPGKVRGCYIPDPGTEQKRLEIRRAAARLASELGVWRLSVREVAKAVHLRGPTVAYYYANREEMIADIATEHLAGLAETVGDALDGVSGLGPAMELEALAVAFLRRVLAERHEHRLLIRSGDVLSGQDRVLVAARWDTLTDLVRSRLTAAAPGLLNDHGRATVLAVSLIGALSNAALWFDPEGAVSVEAYPGMLVRMALAEAARAGSGVEVGVRAA